MKLSTKTITITFSILLLGIIALITMGIFISSYPTQPVDSQATVQAIVTQTMLAIQNVFTTQIPQPLPSSTARSAGGSALTVTILQNAQYHSSTWGDYQLVDGVYYRTPATPGETPGLYSTQLSMPTFGDINGDGVEDAAVILQTYNGGNGNNKELAIVLDQNGAAYNVATVDIGFMIGVDTIQIQSGIITLNVRTLGPNDGMCCPSQQEAWRFRLENNQLNRTP